MYKTIIKGLKGIGRNLGLKYALSKIKEFRQTEIDRKKYLSDMDRYKKMNTRDEFSYEKKYEFPCIHEYRGQAGYPGTYFWQDLWGAQRIVANHPRKHYDIGSRVDGFISHMMLFPEIELHFIDIRPMNKLIPGTYFVQADATNLEGIPDNSIESLSALCSFEHFGLGRYGDSVDPEACFKAFSAVQRVVKVGGYIYISVPVGENHVCFNAHRVFNPRTIIEEFDRCICEELSIIDLDSDPVIYKLPSPNAFAIEPNVDHYCGLFMFRKAR
jgi:hypothetical protein